MYTEVGGMLTRTGRETRLLIPCFIVVTFILGLAPYPRSLFLLSNVRFLSSMVKP